MNLKMNNVPHQNTEVKAKIFEVTKDVSMVEIHEFKLVNEVKTNESHINADMSQSR